MPHLHVPDSPLYQQWNATDVGEKKNIWLYAVHSDWLYGQKDICGTNFMGETKLIVGTYEAALFWVKPLVYQF